MANALKIWRMLAVVSATAVALALVGAAFAQAPPTPPQKFFGSSDTGSAATLDGATAADGLVVSAWNADGDNVGNATIANGTWTIDVNSTDATSVSFKVDGVNASANGGASVAVTSGGLSEVILVASAGTAPPPTGLPNTGSGGLASDGSGTPLLPLTLAGVALVMMLGGVAVTRRVRS